MKGHNKMKMIDTLTILVTVICGTYLAVIFTACDDSNNEQQTQNETEVPAKQCKDLVPTLAKCYDLADWGIESIEQGQNDCNVGNADSYDHCLFKCNSDFVDCETFTECVDDCG